MQANQFSNPETIIEATFIWHPRAWYLEWCRADGLCVTAGPLTVWLR